MINSVDFAKYILLVAKEKGINDINVTKLQKLLYICDGSLLAFNHNVINENARAWNYGPVYPKVYKWFSKLKDYQPSENDIPHEVLSEINNNNYKSIVNATLNTFGSLSAIQLSVWSHKPNSPWTKTIMDNKGKFNSVITKEDMAEYFKRIVHAN